MLTKKTHFISTLNHNREFNTKPVKNKAEQYLCNASKIDSRDVVFLTTEFVPGIVEVSRKRDTAKKASIIIQHNASDQKVSYGSAGRNGINYYHKVAIELLREESYVTLSEKPEAQATGKNHNLVDYQQRRECVVYYQCDSEDNE